MTRNERLETVKEEIDQVYYVMYETHDKASDIFKRAKAREEDLNQISIELKKELGILAQDPCGRHSCTWCEFQLKDERGEVSCNVNIAFYDRDRNAFGFKARRGYEEAQEAKRQTENARKRSKYMRVHA